MTELNVHVKMERRCFKQKWWHTPLASQPAVVSRERPAPPTHISVPWLVRGGQAGVRQSSRSPRRAATHAFGVPWLAWPALSPQQAAAVAALVCAKSIEQLRFCQGLPLFFISPPKLEL